MGDVNLPAIVDAKQTSLQQLTDALGVPRTVLASDAEILRAWHELPRLINRIPENRRSELHVRMCVAVSTGLFDAAINYAWNSAILGLRDKVRQFGLNVVPQIIEDNFDEKKLLDLTDHDLLKLCLSLNLISEDAFFFLNQSREIRNNFSSAHPPIGALDDDEFIVFLGRCARYALSETSSPQGVDARALVKALKQSRHTDDQRDTWVDRIRNTHEAQRILIITMLHGMYCDPDSTSVTKQNAIGICNRLREDLSPKAKSDLINRHSDYVAQGDQARNAASQEFFRELQALALLNEQERHSIVSAAASDLLRVHNEYNNFYNEPPFAKRLAQIAEQGVVPDSAREEFVEAVVTCGIGNQWGVSNAAMPSYEYMVRRFGPEDIEIMLRSWPTHSTIGIRLKNHEKCRSRYRDLVQLLDRGLIANRTQKAYQTWTAS
jgi:hypothetical protein